MKETTGEETVEVEETTGEETVGVEETTGEEAALITDQKKCTKQYVQNARKNAKCHSSQQKDEMFSVETVLTVENNALKTL